jgi:streptogramin lyase
MTTAGQLSEFAITPPARAAGRTRPAPRHLTQGPDGAIWFSDPGDGAIGRISADGSVNEFPVPATATNPAPTPDEIAAGPEGLVWFTEDGAGEVGSVDPAASTGRMTDRVAGPVRRLEPRCRTHAHVRTRSTAVTRGEGQARPLRGCIGARRFSGAQR